MNSLTHLVTALTVTLGVWTTTGYGAQRGLPEAAENAIRANFPDARITGIGRERERGAWYYEVNLRQGTRRFEVEITDAGVIGEIEARIKFGDLADEVQDLVRQRTHGGKIVRVEKHERRGIARNGRFVPLREPTILYEIRYVTRDGRRREIRVASNQLLELPDRVRDAIAAKFPKARITEAEAEADTGVMLFVVELEQDGERFEVVAARDGRLLEIEVPISPSHLPSTVPRFIEENTRRTDRKIVWRRETDAVVENGRIVGRHDIAYIVRVRRGNRMREFRLDGRGRLAETSDWEPVSRDDDGDEGDNDGD